jgi:hypothetical protein
MTTTTSITPKRLALTEDRDDACRGAGCGHANGRRSQSGHLARVARRIGVGYRHAAHLADLVGRAVHEWMVTRFPSPRRRAVPEFSDNRLCDYVILVRAFRGSCHR